MTARTLVCGLSAAIALLAAGPASASAPTAAEAEAWARAINLGDADLPGFVSTPAEVPTAVQRRESNRFARCAGSVPLRRSVGYFSSSTFERVEETPSYQLVFSSVTVMPTAALARRDLQASATRRARRCAARKLAGEFAQMRVLRVSVTRRPAPAPGVVALRAVVVTRSYGLRMRTFLDIYGFVRGPVEVGLALMSLPRAFPATTAGDLLTRLQSRAAQALP